MNKKDLETNAGIIWSLLAKHGKLSFRELTEVTGFRDSVLLLSLGWLAREDKIVFNEHPSGVHVELSHSISEFYF